MQTPAIESLLERCETTVSRGGVLAAWSASAVKRMRYGPRRPMAPLTSGQLGRLISWHAEAAFFARDTESRRGIARSISDAQEELRRREFT